MRTTTQFRNGTAMYIGVDIRVFIILCSSFLFFINLTNASEIGDVLETAETNVFGGKIGDQLIVELDAIELASYKVYVDGMVYQGVFEEHELKNIHVFDTRSINDGDFFIHGFEIEGVSLESNYANINQFLNQLNTVDLYSWEYDKERDIIFGGNPNTDYGNILFSKINDKGQVYALGIVQTQISKNYIIDIPVGTKEIEIRNFVDGTSTTLYWEENTFVVNG